MPDREPRRWRLTGFEERLDEFLEAEGLTDYGDLELIVLLWIHDRQHNPYEGVRREPGFENLWCGARSLARRTTAVAS